MINFTLRDVATKQLTIALKVFTILIYVITFFCFFKSTEDSLIVDIAMATLIAAVLVFLIAILFPELQDKEEEWGREQFFFAALFFLLMLIIFKCSFTIFFYDDFIARVSDILPYLGGYALIYALVVTIHLLSKKMKVGYPEGLIDEYKKASKQKGEDAKLFTNGNGVLPNISDLDKNITKNINIKSL